MGTLSDTGGKLTLVAELVEISLWLQGWQVGSRVEKIHFNDVDRSRVA